MIVPAFLIPVVIVIVFSACLNRINDTLAIVGVSNKVYEQIEQHYFFWSTQTDILLGDVEPEDKGSKCFTEHELMDDAVDYAEEHEGVGGYEHYPTKVEGNVI